MADEQFTLSGIEFHDGLPFFLNELDLTPPKKTLQWAKAAQQDGSTLIAPPFHELREIKATLQVAPQASMNAAMDAIGTLVDQLQLAEQTAAGGQSKGLAATYVPAGSTYTFTFYVKAGEVTGIPRDITSGWVVKAPKLEVTLYCEPAAYGAELTSSTTTAATPTIEKTMTATGGDIAAEARLIIGDNATQARDHLEFGVDKDTGSTLIAAGSLITSGFAGSATTRAGAYLSNTIEVAASGATQVLCGTGDLSHVGTYRVKGRVQNPGTDFNLTFQFGYRIGRNQFQYSPLVKPVQNGKWCEVDFGFVTITAAQLGTQSWEGRVLAQYTGGGNNTAALNYLELIPATNGYGKARAPALLGVAGVTSAHDEFTQSAGSLSGKTANQGGNWVTSGAATDFQTTGTGISHAAAGDRLATLPVSLTNTATYIDHQVPFPLDSGTTHIAGSVARKISASSFCLGGLRYSSGSSATAFIVKNPALSSIITPAASVTFPVSAGQWYRIGLVVANTGWAALFINGSVVVAMYDVDFVTAGTMASGNPGFYGWGSTTDTRYFDNFAAWVPTVDHVTESTRSTEWRAFGNDPVLRVDSTNTYWGRPPEYNGSRFWLPTGTSRIAVKSRRFDVDVLPDEFVTDSTTVTVKHRPRWIVVPRTT